MISSLLDNTYERWRSKKSPDEVGVEVLDGLQKGVVVRCHHQLEFIEGRGKIKLKLKKQTDPLTRHAGSISMATTALICNDIAGAKGAV